MQLLLANFETQRKTVRATTPVGTRLGGRGLAEKPHLSRLIQFGFVFHKASNPLVRFILRSRAHAVLSGQLVLITYTGRISGVKHTLPVRYAKSGNELIVISGYHQYKKWWRNLRQQSTVNVCYRGEWIQTTATAYEGDASVVVPRLEAYLKRFPASARIRGLTLDPSGNIQDSEKLREAAKKAVIVIIQLPRPPAGSKNP